MILILVLRVFRKMLFSIEFGRETVTSKQNLNKMVTISHIILILGYTVITSLVLNAQGNTSILTSESMIMPWTIIGGVSDLYLTCMVWFIFDKNKSLSVYKDDHRSYSIVDVVK